MRGNHDRRKKRKTIEERIRKDSYLSRHQGGPNKQAFKLTIDKASHLDPSKAILICTGGRKLISDEAYEAFADMVKGMRELDISRGQMYTWMESGLPLCAQGLELPLVMGGRVHAMACMWAEYEVKEPGVIPDLVANLYIEDPERTGSIAGWARATSICSSSVFVDVGEERPILMIAGCTYGLSDEGKIVALQENTTGANHITLPFLATLAAQHEGRAKEVADMIGGEQWLAR